jgi:hypothetical protein
MLVVGIFAVLSWDSVFPNRRDVMVLTPLPVRVRTMFLAKAVASATALGLTVVALHVLSGIAWPLAPAPANSSLLDWILPPGIYRPLAAYWITMLGSGAFIFCSLLCLQGVVAQLLPRRQFLRVSAFLQIAAFCFFYADTSWNRRRSCLRTFRQQRIDTCSNGYRRTGFWDYFSHARFTLGTEIRQVARDSDCAVQYFVRCCAAASTAWFWRSIWASDSPSRFSWDALR